MDLGNYLINLSEDTLVFGLSPILKKFHKENKEKIQPFIKDIHKSTYYYWVSGKSPIPLKFLKTFVKLDKTILTKSFRDMTYVSAGMKKIFLPKQINSELAYLLGAIHGDGHLHKNKKYITLTVDSKEYLEKIISPLFKNLFGIEGHIISFDTYYRIELGSKSLHSFFSLFCPIGKKTGQLKIPKQILKNKELLPAYFSGLFDTDGCIGNSKDKKQFYFVFTQKDKNFVFEVYSALIYLGLVLNKPRIFYSPTKPYAQGRTLEEWRVYIGSKKDLILFTDKINFLHPIKQKKANNIKQLINGPGAN